MLGTKKRERFRNGELFLAFLSGSLAAFVVGYAFFETKGNAGGQVSAKNYEFDLNKISGKEIQKNLKQLTKNMHIAGSVQEEEVLVKMIEDRWKAELDHVEVHTYNVLLSYPNETNPNYVSMVDGNGKEYDKTPFKEPPLTPSETFDDVGNYFTAYGEAGRATGQLVYVNYGRNEDFVYLKAIGVEVREQICIARYGQIFRGDKAKFAELFDCAGLIIFTDPKDYGNVKNYTQGFPDSWWLPDTGIQRGTLMMENGDPLTPDYPSLKYMHRKWQNETTLPNIPVQPISFHDAYKYMSKLGGDDAPDEWQGGFNITYKFGGEFKKEFFNHIILINSGNYRTRKDIRNVIGYIRGAEEPDRYVILGNHRDAWVYGALDPSSGTAVMMEIARALGESMKVDNWRPKRTIIFCSWGAEEYGLIGSYEWVENYSKMLTRNGVVYLNVDIAVEGNATFRPDATPNTAKVLHQVTKNVRNPNSGEIAAGRKTVFDTWVYKSPDKDHPNLPFVGTLGSGSDFTAFLQSTGVSSIDLRHVGYKNLQSLFYPVYHSAHETIEYFEKFLDPEYKISVAMGQIWAELALRFANDEVLPFDCASYSRSLKKLAQDLINFYRETLDEHNIKYYGILRSAEKFNSACQKFNMTINRNDQLALRRLNDKLMYVDRGFLDNNGLPGRSYYKHIVFAPSSKNTYSGSGFPGIVDSIYDAITDGSWRNVQKEFDIAQFMIASAANVFGELLPTFQ